MIWKNPASIVRMSQLLFLGTQVAARCCYSYSEMVKQHCIWRNNLESTMKILSPLAVIVKILIAPHSETCSQKHWRTGERGSRKRENNKKDGEKTKRERWIERGKISSNWDFLSSNHKHTKYFLRIIGCMKPSLMQELKIIKRHLVFFCPTKWLFIFRSVYVISNSFFVGYILPSIAPLEMLVLIFCSLELGRVNGLMDRLELSTHQRSQLIQSLA